MKEFLFGNVQIGFKNQRLLYKESCMELGTPHETQSYLHFQTKIQIWEWGREREREIEKKGTDEIPYTNLCCVILLCLMLLSLSVPLFFLLSMSLLCVCTYSLFVSLSFFFSSFLYLCVPLSNYKEIPKKLFLILLSTDQIMEQFSSVFFLHNS